MRVVDADDLLLGIITVDDVVDVLVDEATEDIQRLGGAQPLERSFAAGGSRPHTVGVRNCRSG